MQIKDLLTVLAIPAVVLSAAIPQDPTEIPDWENGSQEDIVGGTTASAGEFPFIVSLQRSGSHFCGGTLLNANTILTAAHCAVGQTASSLSVRAGSNVSFHLLCAFSMLHISTSKPEYVFSNLALLYMTMTFVWANTLNPEPYLRRCCCPCLLHQGQPWLRREHLQR